MKKKINKFFLFSIVGLFVAFVLFLNYEAHFSGTARKGKANIENIKKVEEGMTVNEVISIMGKPDVIDYCDFERILRGYNYKTNDDSFVHVTVCFDSTMRVKQIYFPKE